MEITDKTKFKNVRTLAAISNDPRIDEVLKDPDGWWAYFKAGWVSDHTECMTMRGDTIKELCEKINYSSPSYCAECHVHLWDGYKPGMVPGAYNAPNLYSGYLCWSCKKLLLLQGLNQGKSADAAR